MADTGNEGKSLQALELEAEIDEQHQLHAQLPSNVPPARVRVIVLFEPSDKAKIASVSAKPATQTVQPTGFDSSTFGGLQIETKGFKFDRDEANER